MRKYETRPSQIDTKQASVAALPSRDVYARNVITALLVALVFFGMTFSKGALGFQNNNFRQFHFPEPIIATVNTMTNEQVFLAAEVQRSGLMSLAAAKANYQWLQRKYGSEYSGSRALKEVAKLALIEFRPKLDGLKTRLKFRSTDKTKKPAADSAVPYVKPEPMALQNIDNYSVRVSPRRIKLTFQYEF